HRGRHAAAPDGIYVAAVLRRRWRRHDRSRRRFPRHLARVRYVAGPRRWRRRVGIHHEQSGRRVGPALFPQRRRTRSEWRITLRRTFIILAVVDGARAALLT